MNKTELVKKLIEEKTAELAVRPVYTGRIDEEGQWTPTSLHERYQDFVLVVPAPEEGEPVPTIGEYEFVGGNSNRIVYIHRSIIKQWLEVAGGDSHWGAAVVLRPGKLASHNAVFSWEGYQLEESDEGLLAIMDEGDWKVLLEAYDLDPEVRLVQVTIFDLEGWVSGKGTLRKVLPGERATVFPNSWKRFGILRTEFMSVLTTDAHYSPRASINLQELTYYVWEAPAKWVFDALDEEIERIINLKTSPWLTTGYLTRLGFSPAWNSTLTALKESLSGELKKLLRRIKLSGKYGLRAKSTASHLLRDGELMLPAYAKKHVKVGDFVTVSRNPALPSQGWGQYRVAGFIDGNMVVFPQNDYTWSAVLGGDHDGDDAIVWYRPPVEGYRLPEDTLDLQAIKPQARKLDANTIEARIQRWTNERAVNIGQFDLAARRLMATGKLNREEAKLLSVAIQTAISLKKRVAKLKEQPWWSRVAELLEESKKLAGTTWVDLLRNGQEPVGAPDWVLTIYQKVREAIRRVEKLEPRLWLTETKVKEFAKGATVPASCEALVQYREGLLKAKAIAVLNGDGDTVARLNKELREFVHVTVPQHLMTIDEEAWKEFSRWAIGNTHSNEWVFWCHPAILEELYDRFGKRTIKAIALGGTPNLAESEVIELEDQELIDRVFEVEGVKYALLDETGYLKAGRLKVIRVRKSVVEFEYA